MSGASGDHGPARRSRPRRWLAIAGFAVRRTVGQLARRGPAGRTGTTVAVVAAATALLVLVTAVSLGLAAGATVQAEGVDYWVVPESATTLTTAVSVAGPQFGDVHAGAEQMRSRPGVAAVTPVLLEVVEVHSPASNATARVLGVGVVPAPGIGAVAGVDTAALAPGDPYYAGGAYDGAFTGEVVLSPAAAELLGAAPGDPLTIASPASPRVGQGFTVAAVSDTGLQTVQGQVPVAVVHLAELQAYTGARGGDQADQFLVRTDDPGAAAALREQYPEGTVVTRTGLATRRLFDASLPLAVSVTALAVGLVVSTLFVATTMGIAVEADRRELAVLAAVGFSPRARLALVAATTLAVSAAGGVLGALVGAAGCLLLNRIVAASPGAAPVALFDPLLLPYGVGVAVLAGLLAAPYPVLLARRTAVLEELTR